MSETMAVKLHGVDETRAIEAIKALRVATQCGLRYAKMDVYDHVRAGRAVTVKVDGGRALDSLQEGGWTASIDDDQVVAFSARVPVKYVSALEEIVRAMGGVL